MVLAVPLHWSQKSRQQYCKAVRDGGFEVLHVITEPSAALLAYNLGVDANETCNVLVVRLGGLSSDLTIMEVQNGLYSVVDSVHLPHLGGNILTQALSEYLAAEFNQKWKLDPRESRRTMVKLNATAENVKHILSTMPSAHVFVESLMDGIDWSQNISRARFENIIAPKLTLFSKPIDEFIKKNNVQIDKVIHFTPTEEHLINVRFQLQIIYTGGTMKIPKLQTAISSLFPNAEVLSTIPPDEVISIGCANQAAYVNGDGDEDGEQVDMEITTLPTDVRVICVDADQQPIEGSDSDVLFRKGATVPSAHGVTIAKSMKKPVRLSVVQGEHSTVIECKDSEKDLVEITARVHGGVRLNASNSQTTEPATIHIHLD